MKKALTKMYLLYAAGIHLKVLTYFMVQLGIAGLYLLQSTLIGNNKIHY